MLHIWVKSVGRPSAWHSRTVFRHARASVTLKTEQILKKKKSSDIFPSKETTERLAPLFFVACGQREQCGRIKGTDKVKQDLTLWTSGLYCPTR